jgi:hypothetical protein
MLFLKMVIATKRYGIVFLLGNIALVMCNGLTCVVSLNIFNILKIMKELAT